MHGPTDTNPAKNNLLRDQKVVFEGMLKTTLEANAQLDDEADPLGMFEKLLEKQMNKLAELRRCHPYLEKLSKKEEKD